MSIRFRDLALFGFLLTITISNADTICSAETASDSSAAQSASAPRDFGHKRKIKGVGNFGEVTPTIFRGAQPTAQGFDALAKMGVDIVVDARGERAKSEGKVVQHLGMQYVSLPWHCPFPHDETFVKFLKLVKENPQKKIFVHCRLGDDRTGMMIAAYRMAAEGWTADEALREMQIFGFSRAHHFICPSLGPYEQAFPHHLQSNPAFEGLH